MSITLTQNAFDLTEIVKNLVTEDDEPVDNIFSEKQQRLLVDPLYESWTPLADEDAPEVPRKFWAASNVGIFRSIHLPAIAPDMFLSLDVAVPEEFGTGLIRSYFMWETGKAPDVVVEIVSNREGNELGSKLKDYARMGVTYYIVFDPFGHLRAEMAGEQLLVYEIGFGKRFRPREDAILPEVGLQLVLWQGRFEDAEHTWLRWRDRQENLLLTGHESARQAEERAVEAEERALRLAARLREMGVDPEKI